MITKNNITTISDLRFKTKEVLKKAEKTPLFVFNRSIPQSVVMSYDEYVSLMSELEDNYNAQLAEGYEKEDKSKVKWYSQEEVEKILLNNAKSSKA